jgi:16S rRNA (cytidine1402-2'-O)-methyltransferase
MRAVDVIAAEDTRHSRVLFNHFSIRTPCTALHEHNEEHAVAALIERLQAGDSVALISDAGTPLISDPGFRLVRAAQQAGVKVMPVPGPSAVVAALSVSGLPSDRFIFEGFLPARGGHRRQALQLLSNETRTLIFYESPHRILESLQDMATVFGGQRRAVLARELTKLFETVLVDTLEGLCQRVQSDSNQQKGEMVILVHGAEVQDMDEAGLRVILEPLLAELPLKQAVALTAKISGANKNVVYELALKIKDLGFRTRT